MASISLESVSKVYPNGFEAVKELDLEISDGELMVVVGPSAAARPQSCAWSPAWSRSRTASFGSASR